MTGSMAGIDATGDRLNGRTPPLFAFPLPRPWWLRLLVLLLVVAILSGAGYLGATRYPEARPARGSAAEAEIARVFGVPRDRIDDRIVGDFLVERFYILDAETGSRYVGDLMKGQIQSVQTNIIENGLTQYTLVLNLQNLYRDRSLFAAFVQEVARPREPGVGEYLGMRTPNGLSDAFLINYTGLLPAHRLPFSSAEGENLQQFLLSRRLSTAAPELISVEGYNYLLSNTEAFPYFRAEFGLNQSIFVSELLIVDATAPEQLRTYYKLTEKYPRTAGR